VVKVFEATMNSVRAASAILERVGEISAVDVGTRNATRGAPRASVCSASTAIAGPRSEPPMPMLITV
jgi:hypothetical protein